MAIRINPDLQNTEKLLGEILEVIVPTENRVSFLCAAGSGHNVMARIRVMLGRKRNKLRRKGRKPRLFTLRNSIHPETHDGLRYDCVVVWREVKESDWLSEQLEDLLTNG